MAYNNLKVLPFQVMEAKYNDAQGKKAGEDISLAIELTEVFTGQEMDYTNQVLMADRKVRSAKFHDAAALCLASAKAGKNPKKVLDAEVASAEDLGVQAQ